MNDHKIPFSIKPTLHNLHHAVDALRRLNIIEAQKYIRDSLAAANNEVEWVFNTDTELTSVIRYLEVLDICVSVALVQSTTCNKVLVSTIIEEIQELNKQL